ncbi:hypothetical protein GGX14DRAFT_587804 [Mycena pura]|uniref:Uncharacterized protein n=1 Tax=Mycena pura TaxID=153505 RepID=A0AAD6UT16_9AGAR|nr:hypothetical protein GGX14DRAFT_587804 [Mycena pura]
MRHGTSGRPCACDIAVRLGNGTSATAGGPACGRTGRRQSHGKRNERQGQRTEPAGSGVSGRQADRRADKHAVGNEQWKKGAVGDGQDSGQQVAGRTVGGTTGEQRVADSVRRLNKRVLWAAGGGRRTALWLNLTSNVATNHNLKHKHQKQYCTVYNEGPDTSGKEFKNIIYNYEWWDGHKQRGTNQNIYYKWKTEGGRWREV